MEITFGPFFLKNIKFNIFKKSWQKKKEASEWQEVKQKNIKY